MEIRGRHAGAVKDFDDSGRDELAGGAERAFAPKHAASSRPPTSQPRMDLSSLPKIEVGPRDAGRFAAGMAPAASGVPMGSGEPRKAASDAKASKPAKAKVSAWDFAAAGTYVDASLPKPFAWVVVVLGLVAILLPSIGMAWAFTDSTSENRELAAAPSFVGEDGAPNISILSDAGTWFEDHFAYRNQMVAANAGLRAALGTSSTDQVVVGSDGWLYYGGTLPDYLGQSALSERALVNIAHNLKLAQDYVEGHGAQFLFVVAPNKNTLYAQNMPYYYLRFSGESNFERLKPYLDAEGVDYLELDLFFEQEPGIWYMKTDSHWDNRGALMATNEALRALGRDELEVGVESATARADFLGDLESMLKPSGPQLEENYYYAMYNDGENATGDLWHYQPESEQDVTADWIQTESGAGEGSLLMFRDSFGNALVPFWSTVFESSAFSKLVPYNLPAMNQVKADAVVVERAERHLPYLAENPPIMVSPRVKAAVLAGAQQADVQQTSLEAATDGPYLVLSGVVDRSALTADMRIYVSVTTAGGQEAVYDAFWTSAIADDGSSEDGGYLVRVDASRIGDKQVDVNVYGVSGETAICLGEFPGTSIG